jgi:hypothetical protein
VDRVLEAWHSAERGTVLPLDELIAEAQIIVPRLNVLISHSRTTEVLALVLTSVTAITGLSFSIPSVLSRWALSDYWLLIGPILFVFGGIATAYLFLNERRERKRIRMAAFVQFQLKELIARIERFRQRNNKLELAKSE